MQASGVVQKINKNGGGFYGVRVNNEWFGLSKSAPKFQEGDSVSFEYYLKDDKYKTVKGSVDVKAAEPPTETKQQSAGGKHYRDTYWNDKAAADAAKEPRIAYQGAYERAVEVFKIVEAKGGYPAIEKAKAANKLGVIRALIEAEADHIMALAWNAKAPAEGVKGTDAPEPAKESEAEEEGGWDENE